MLVSGGTKDAMVRGGCIQKIFVVVVKFVVTIKKDLWCGGGKKIYGVVGF